MLRTDTQDIQTKDNNSKLDSKGFTIIEVLIVLAIVGLIMLIVFLAVPALQRNSRNTQYKNDSASLLAATTEFSNNNNGATLVAGSSATAGTNAEAIKNLAKTRSITTLVITSGAGGTTPTVSQATIRTGAKCGTITGGNSHTTLASAGRAIAMIYAVEDSSGAVIAQCTES